MLKTCSTFKDLQGGGTVTEQFREWCNQSNSDTFSIEIGKYDLCQNDRVDALVKLLLFEKSLLFVIQTGNSDTWSNSENAIQTSRGFFLFLFTEDETFGFHFFGSNSDLFSYM